MDLVMSGVHPWGKYCLHNDSFVYFESISSMESWPACGLRRDLRRASRTALRLVPTEDVGIDL